MRFEFVAPDFGRGPKAGERPANRPTPGKPRRESYDGSKFEEEDEEENSFVDIFFKIKLNVD